MRLSRVDPLKAEQLVAQGAGLIDVRSPGEFAAGHLPGARLVPLQQLLSNPKQLGDTQAEWVLYCASGARSALALRALRRAGFRHVHDLGSLGRWPYRPALAEAAAEEPSMEQPLAHESQGEYRSERADQPETLRETLPNPPLN
jgi:rhodanese-related sulfurtransferase